MVMNADGLEHVLAFLEQQRKAYVDHPDGTWAQRWIPGVCKHEETRCVHGDEINHRNGARRACLVCDRSLRKRPLPLMCFFTNQPHVDQLVTPRQ